MSSAPVVPPIGARRHGAPSAAVEPVVTARAQSVLRERPFEIAVSVALALAGITALGVRPLDLAVVWLAAVTPRLVAVDIAEHRLPDAIVLPGYPIVLASAALDGVALSRGPDAALTAAVAYGGLLLLVHIAGGMGLGDVKLAPVLGLIAGTVGARSAILSPVLAFVTGGVVAAAVLIRSGPRTSLPFGPPMLLGAWAALVLA